MSAGSGTSVVAPFEFTRPSEKPTVNVLLYGPPKTGKSIGASTAPGGVLYLNCDIGNATRQVHLRNPDGRIMEIKQPEYVDGTEPWLALLAQITNTVADPKQSMVDSVVIDPVGELYRHMLEDHSRRSMRPTLPTYGDVGTHIERFCRRLCNIPTINTIFVCHELVQKDEASGEMKSIPYTGTQAGSAVLGNKLLGMVDIVGYTGVVETEDGQTRYVSQLISGRGRTGGDRFAVLESVEETNIANWLERIYAAESKPKVETVQPEPEPAKTTTRKKAA